MRKNSFFVAVFAGNVDTECQSDHGILHARLISVSHANRWECSEQICHSKLRARALQPLSSTVT